MLSPLALSFGNALQLPCRTAGLTSVWSRFKNTLVKAEPAASVCANMQSWLAFRHTPAQPCPGSQQGANKPGLCSGRWSDAQQALCARDKWEPARSRALKIPWGKWRKASPPHFKAGCGGKFIFPEELALCPKECQGQSHN